MAIRNAAKAIILHNGSVLLNKCIGAQGEVYYDLPGGGQNQFETMEEAVVRECREETGYLVKPVRFAALAEEIYGDEELRREYYDYSHRVHHIFIAEIAADVLQEATEKDFHQVECQWVAIEKIAALDIRPIQLQSNFERILSSTCPVYLGSIRID